MTLFGKNNPAYFPALTLIFIYLFINIRTLYLMYDVLTVWIGQEAIIHQEKRQQQQQRV